MSAGDDFLAIMATASARRAEALLEEAGGESPLLDRARQRLAPPPLTLQDDAFEIIAEIKLRSPAAGALAEAGEDLEARAVRYGAGGACAVSVLTEPDRFGGSLDHLERVARALDARAIPVMAKDFLVHPAQIAAARAAGASGVLLIVTMLDDSQCARMLTRAAELGMFVLLEAFDARDLARAGSLLEGRGSDGPPVMVGLNSRDLRTLKVDPDRLLRLADCFPAGWPRVAESGISTPEEAAAMAAAGYDAGLVGTALMSSPEPEQLVRRLREAGSSARVAGR
jgi:indole-3-glycerol phosphate synthase